MKPEAFQHRKVGRLSIWARWLWVGMLHYADDDGRLIADHGELLARFFGYDRDVTESKVEAWLTEVAGTGLVVLYADADGTPLAYFPDWHEHQRIDRPKPSHLPEPPPRESAPEKAPRKRPHRKTGRIPSGRPSSEKRPEPEDGPHSEGLPSTTDRRDVDGASPTDRRVDRIGSDRDLDLETPPNPHAASAAPSVDVEAEMLGQDNGHRAGKSKTPKHREADPPGFVVVWAAYPEHEDRAQAVKRFREIPADVTVEMLLAGIARWKESDRWARGFVPYLSRWLKEKRWEAEPRAASGLSPKTSGNADAARRAAARIQGAVP